METINIKKGERIDDLQINDYHLIQKIYHCYLFLKMMSILLRLLLSPAGTMRSRSDDCWMKTAGRTSI